MKGQATIQPRAAIEGSSRVLRGGSWGYVASYCRSANRNLVNPGLRYGDCGFRLVFVP
ncbi:MAG: SUMF1/EgtB/PvdO family nonheme iron enzyme [candidate division KSB1 bacterium]|nr:SUMF1/EgtB/PvdO family nonheme iron enzyme [candidate division KSB1 bacterium]MDZ7340357.1 SUMF1/EgtB/PvdO family nonheme iron enzyme [candidate division KSB1 bacterium]